MASTTNKDIENKVNRLERKVDSITQRQDEVLIPGITDIKSKIENLTFVSQKDYDNDMYGEDGVMARLKALEKTVNVGGVKLANALSSGVSKAIIGALVVGILALIVWSLARVTPALGGV